MSTPACSGSDSAGGSDGGRRRDPQETPQKRLIFDLQDENAQLVQDGSRKDAENASLRSEIGRLTEELSRMPTENARLSIEANRYYGETVQLRQEVDQRTRDNERLSHELAWAQNGSAVNSRGTDGNGCYCRHCFQLQ